MANPFEASQDEMLELIEGRLSTDPAWFDFDGTTVHPADVVGALRDHLSPERRQAIEDALHERTMNVAVVVEGMVDTGNVAALVRSADAFGVHAVHAIDTADTYKRSNRTARGAEKWVDRQRWTSAAECAAFVHDHGYSIVAFGITETSMPITDVDLTRRVALVFGNESDGLSEEMLQLADQVAEIPMSGFTRSLNLSVAGAIALYETGRQRRAAYGRNGDLDDETIERLRAVWYLKAVREGHRIVSTAVARSDRSTGSAVGRNEMDRGL